MNLIPESNGLYKLKREGKFKRIPLIKRIILGLVAIIILGVLSQSISNFIGNEKIESKLTYAKIDNKKLEYDLKGEGDYTVIFDGSLGTNLYEWNNVTQEIQEELNVKTFVYNRRGYGFSDLGDKKTPKEQAEDLRILIRKAGVSGNIILVGQEYGSLVMTNYAQMFPESVKGVVLIDPYNEEEIKTEEFRNSIKNDYLRSKGETVGCYFGVTMLLDKFNLARSYKQFEDSLEDMDRTEYLVQKTNKKYRQAVEDELANLINYNESSQVDKMLEGKPLYIISRKENESLTKLGNEELTNLYVTSTRTQIISIGEQETVINGISDVLKEARKIEKKASKNNQEK